MSTFSGQPNRQSPACDVRDDLVLRIGLLSSSLARDLTQSASCLRDPMLGQEVIFFRVAKQSDVSKAQQIIKQAGAVDSPRPSYNGELSYRGVPVVVVCQPGIQLHDATLPPPTR